MSKEYLSMYISALSEINLSTGFSFGRTIIAQVLTASKSKNVLRFNNLESYGKGVGKAQSWWIEFSKNISKVPNILSEKISENASTSNVIITYELGTLGKLLLSIIGASPGGVSPGGAFPEIELPITKSVARKVTVDGKHSQEQTYNMFFNHGKTIAEIAEERGLKSSTISQHLINAKNDGRELSPETIIDPGTLEKIKEAWKTIGGERLKPVKEYLGDSFTYEDIRWAKAFM